MLNCVLILCNPLDCSQPGSCLHRIFQARILGWVAISSSTGSSWWRDRTSVSCICIGKRIIITIIILPLVPPGSLQFSSITQSCPTLCNSMDWSTPGLPVYHQLLDFIQTHVHWAGDGIQPSHLLSSPSPPTFNLSQHQGLFQWVSSSHQVAKVLELQLQHQSFQRIFRTDFL